MSSLKQPSKFLKPEISSYPFLIFFSTLGRKYHLGSQHEWAKAIRVENIVRAFHQSFVCGARFRPQDMAHGLKLEAIPRTARMALTQVPGAGRSLVAIHRIGRMRMGDVAERVDTSPPGHGPGQKGQRSCRGPCRRYRSWRSTPGVFASRAPLGGRRWSDAREKHS
jgi:hypothetical protein